jgi:NitT/TauT family transport system substrate-binding protein
MVGRRRFLYRSSQWLAALAFTPLAHAATRRVTLSVPGPGNLLFLPLALAPKIGADQAEGLTFDINYVGGGPQAFRAMLERNSDFSCGGLAALALQKFSGRPVICVAPITRVPAYTILVRNDLRSQVRRMADLKGRVVGVKGHVPGGRSTSQLFAEYLLAQAGVPVDQVNYVSAGQSYDSQHAALVSGTVDAVVADEPFATRLAQQKVGFVLADYHELETTRRLLGGLFLNGMLATREDVVASQPDLVERTVRTIRRTLAWIESHSAAQMVDALAPSQPEERAALREVLALRKHIYSPDGRFSGEQLDTAQRFLYSTEPEMKLRNFSVRSMVNTRWAGSAD